MNKYEAAERREIKVFDTALPQTWVNDVQDMVGNHVEVAAHFVWSYDPVIVNGEPRRNLFGRPEPISGFGDLILMYLPQTLSYREEEYDRLPDMEDWNECTEEGCDVYVCVHNQSDPTNCRCKAHETPEWYDVYTSPFKENGPTPTRPDEAV